MSKSKKSYLGTKPHTPKPVELTRVQKKSWDNFIKKGLEESLRSVFPIEDYTGKNWELEFKDLVVNEPAISPGQAIRQNKNYASSIDLKVTLYNKRKNSQKTSAVFVVSLPMMTDQGTFIISGIERCINNQLVRSPGVYFSKEQDKKTGIDLYHAELRPLRGAWLDFFVGRKKIIYAQVNRRRRFPVTIILRALGLEHNRAIIKEFSKFIQPTIEADPSRNKEEAMLEFYRKLKPGEPAVYETAEKNFKRSFFQNRSYSLGRPGRYKFNKKLGLSLDDKNKENYVLKEVDIFRTLKHLIDLQTGEKQGVDDIDHLGNRRIRRVGEVVSQTVLRFAIMRFERMVKERMSLASPNKNEVTPTRLVSSQIFANAVNSFFRTNQLSSILDRTNPLAELSLLRKVTVLGPGGLTRERSAFSVRDIHESQYGRICPVKSPEGPNIGLVTYLAMFARINEYGFIETPYCKVKKVKNGGKLKMQVTDEVVYLPADEEAEYYITNRGIDVDEKGIVLQDRIPVRYKGEFFETSAEKVQMIDYVSQQVLGVSAALVPFIAHDEPQRALMGASMQCQATPLIDPEPPLVGTGLETVVAQSMDRVIKAQESGKVVYADAEKIVVKSKDGKKNYRLNRFHRTTPYGTCFSHRTLVEPGDKIKKGEILADGSAVRDGELALGKNLVIAYCQYEGLVFEDGIAISDRLLNEDGFTSIQINEYEAEVVDTKLGPEVITKDIPSVSEEALSNLTEDGIVMLGAKVKSNDILVGKVEPRGEKELTAEERLLRAIFGEKAKDVKDTSLRVPHGEKGTVIDVQVLDRDKDDELKPGVNKIIKVFVAELRKVKEGDKLAGRHGNKGVVSRVVPQRDMPYLKDGTPVDIVISPLSVIARMNLGQILEMHLAWVAQETGKRFAVPAFEKFSEDKLHDMLKRAGLPVDGKVTLYNGKTGLPYEQKISVGSAYIMKLIHMADDKAHARSTGPYSLVTQQPLGGKARRGGQRFGEMEVWALEAHQAAYALREMLTIKSDDIIGRSQAFEAIIKGQEIAEPIVPESFKVLTKELAGLGLKVSPVGGSQNG